MWRHCNIVSGSTFARKQTQPWTTWSGFMFEFTTCQAASKTNFDNRDKNTRCVMHHLSKTWETHAKAANDENYKVRAVPDYDGRSFKVVLNASSCSCSRRFKSLFKFFNFVVEHLRRELKPPPCNKGFKSEKINFKNNLPQSIDGVSGVMLRRRRWRW